MLGASLLVGVAVAACSLGLDESKLLDAGTSGPTDAMPQTDVVEAGASDAPVTFDAGVDAAPKFGCSVDADCAKSAGCQASRCDTGRGICVADTCRAACKFTVCDPNAQVCGATEVGSKSVLRTIPLGTGVTVAGRIDKSIAAVHPFVFVTTNTGVAAFAASAFLGQGGADAQAPEAVRLPVTGVGFLPTHLVASGSVLYMFGDPVGPEGARTPVATLDVGAQGFARAIRDPLAAQSAILTPQPAALRPEFSGPQSPGAVLLAQAITGQAGAFAAVIAPPINETAPVVLRATGAGPNLQPVASSKDRLVLFSPTFNGVIFRVVTQAGASNSQMQNAPIDAGAIKTEGPHAFAQGPDGTVVWAHRLLQAGNRDDARVAWLKAGPPDAALVIEHAEVAVDASTQLGAVAFIDVDTVALLVGLAAVPNVRPASSKVVLVRRKVGIVREVQLGNIPIEQVALASSAGFLYVLQTGSPSQLLVIAPDCP